MKNRKAIIATIVLLIVVALLLVGGMIFMMKGNFRVGSKRVSTNLVTDEVYHGSYSRIEVTTDASDIEVKATDESAVHVTIYGDQERSSVRESGNNLKVEAKAKRCFGICFNLTMSKVVVYVPKEYEGELVITNKYGDIMLEEFSSATIKVEEDCGDVEIREAKSIDVVNSYGDITIGKVKDVTLRESCGNIKIDYLEKGDIVNNYGDIEIGWINGEIFIDEDCGDIDIREAVILNDSKIDNSFGNITIGRTNETFIDAKTSLGDVKIDENYRHAQTTLKLHNSCGDIKVSN